MPRDGGFAPPRGRAVVIGAGFGGIAAALRARRLGYAVTIVDRMPATGGRARVFRQDGFTFDAGPTVITAPQLMEELFALFGERMADHVEMLPVRPWYRILFADGRWFDYGSSPEEMRDAVAAFAPGDVDGYDSTKSASIVTVRIRSRRRARCCGPCRRLCGWAATGRCPGWSDDT
jgi:phytoene desaturase